MLKTPSFSPAGGPNGRSYPESMNEQPQVGTPRATEIPQRLLSLDALRGFDMFWIVGAGAIVQALNGVSSGRWVRFLAAQLSHKDWAGFAFLDLVFPLFVFIMGVSLVFSLEKILSRDGRAAAYRRLWTRTCLLFLLGIFNSVPKSYMKPF